MVPGELIALEPRKLVNPSPHPHPTPYTLHLIPYTLHPAPYNLHVDLGVEGAMLIHDLVENALQVRKERHVRACHARVMEEFAQKRVRTRF